MERKITLFGILFIIFLINGCAEQSQQQITGNVVKETNKYVYSDGSTVGTKDNCSKQEKQHKSYLQENPSKEIKYCKIKSTAGYTQTYCEDNKGKHYAHCDGNKQVTYHCSLNKKCVEETSICPIGNICIREKYGLKCSSSDFSEPTPNPIKDDRNILSYVIDGDTIKLSSGKKIRLIGINSPEVEEKCYQEARDYLKQLVENKEVTLEKDIDDKDQYGRLLRYIFVDGVNVNIEMVKQGLAHIYIVGLNTKYKSELENAENIAKSNKGCLWEESINSCQNCIEILNFRYDAAGNDNYNLNDEYVTFQNTCSQSCDLTGWSIKDDTASHIYIIPIFTIQEGASFTLYTGTGTNTNSVLYWGRTNGNYAAIWNNGGDTLYLRDNNGDLVLNYRY